MQDICCIIAVYNGEKYIEEAIESVLQQSLPVRRVIVVDDGSTDATIQRLGKFRNAIEVQTKRHSGVSESLNLGLSLADSEFVAFLDADDIWVPQKIEWQMAAIEERGCDLCFGDTPQFVSPDLTASEAAAVELPAQSVKGYCKTTMLARRTVFELVGNFDTTLDTGDFIDWFSRAIAMDISQCYLDKPLAKRRVHLTNFTRGSRFDPSKYATILRNHLMRMRAKSE